MPIFKEISLSPDDRIMIWEITEPEEELRSLAADKGLDLHILNDFSHSRRRKEWLASRIAAKTLGEDIDIPSTSGKRPESRTHHLSFSHSGDLAAAEVRKYGPAGMDLQEINEKVARIQDRFLHEGERAAVSDNSSLALIWAAKEALYKVYSDPYIIFKEDLLIELPSKELKQGSMKGTIDRNGQVISHDLYFELFENYALVCVRS